MLKQLRIKFVLVNMTIVTIMLGIIFSLLFISASNSLERESMQMMGQIAANPMQMRPPDISRENVRLPYFSVLIDDAGEMTEIGGGFFEFEDEAVVQELVQMTEDSGQSTGIIKEYQLRYIRFDSPRGLCIVFADTTNEQSILQHLGRTCLFLGSIAFLLFLGISILLSHWAVKPVAQAWKQQKQFVADASHELKTPLTVIMTDAELLHASDCPEQDREQLSGSILTMSVQMRGLVESLLELARIDGGSVSKSFQKFSFSETVLNAAMQFEPVFFEKDLPFSYEVEPDIQVNGSSSHLKQVVDILLDNAGKYASPGGNTKLCLKRTTHKHCLLEVANQGEPIAEKDLRNLFKRFYRADQARAMNHSYGLGLSIAQSIAQDHHGKIRAESADGWNRFFVEIPTIS